MSRLVRYRFRRQCCRITSLAIIFAICGCAAGSIVVGDWQAVQGTARVTFKPDGGFEAVDNAGMAVSGRYRLTGVDGIQFEFRHGEHETEVVDARVVREEDRLMLIFPGEASVQHYRRIP
jgi:hypothetical protein